MILSYKTKFDSGKPTDFENKIKRKIKIHSLREDKNNRWRVGMPIQQATGVRSKLYRCFKLDKCKSIQKVSIFNNPEGKWIAIDAETKTESYVYIIAPGTDAMDTFVRNDGFDSEKEFFEFFDRDKVLRCVHWTDHLYK